MSHRLYLRLVIAISMVAPAFPPIVLGQSQDQQTQSVAEAARRAREKKKAAEKQLAPVITDDTLKPSAPASQEANAPPPPSDAAPAPAAAAQPAADSSSAPSASAAPAAGDQAAPGSPTDDADQKAQVSAELTALKQQLAEAQKALELLQRDISLQQDTYFSNPDHSHDTAGKAKLDAMLEQLAGKQQSVDNLKAQLAALQSSLSNIAPATPVTAPPPPPQLL